MKLKEVAGKGVFARSLESCESNDHGLLFSGLGFHLTPARVSVAGQV